MEIVKPNDIFVTSTLAPEVDVNELLKSNILPDNTSFFDKDTYRNTEFAKKAFTDESGNFNELKFGESYIKASNLFTELSNDKFLKNNLEWDAYDFVRPAKTKTRQDFVEIAKDINPYKNLYGRTSFNSIDAGTLSKRELAQQSKVFDTNSGKFLDKSPNDLGLLGSLFRKTLVYAQWDEDGYHKDPYTQRSVAHKKGEDKLNEDGNFYTETLEDREVYGKQVVNPSDLITTDGSYFNKIDYFDSDGRNKSVVGTTFKLATELAPFFIPGTAGAKIGTYYGGIKMAVGLSSVMPTFYKSLEGIILGDTTKGNETDLWKSATKAEGFLAKYNTESYSEHGSESMWNYEQLGSMVGGIFSQIYEQRAAASLSKLFYKANNDEYGKLAGKAFEEIGKGVKAGYIVEDTAEGIAKKAAIKAGELARKSAKQSNLAKSLSLGYMALTSTADIYNEAIAGGYDRRTAGIAALLAASGQYAIMTNNRMSTWFLDDAVGFNAEANRVAMRKAIMPNLDELAKANGIIDINKETGKKFLASAVSKIKKAINEPLMTSNTAEKLYKNAIVEGVEEVTEQMVLDSTKGMIDAMSWLGITGKKGSFNTVENLFSAKGLETYLMNLVGGVIGGGMFELNRLKIEPLLTGNAVSDETNYSLIRNIANGKANEIKEEAKKMVGSMGNNFVSSNTTKIGDDEVFLPDETTSQASIVLGAFNKYVDYLDDLLNSENLKQDNETIIKKTIVDELIIKKLEETGVSGFILSDFNVLSSEIVKLRSELTQLNKETDKDKISKVTSKLKEKREERDAFLNGEKSLYYKKLSLFVLSSNLHSPFISLNVHDYAKKTYNVIFEELPDSTGDLNKKKITEEFNDIINNADNKKTKLKFMYEAFNTMIEKYSNNIGDYAEEKHINTRKKYDSILKTFDVISPEHIRGMQKDLADSSLPGYNLSDVINVPLGDLLEQLNEIDLSSLSPEDRETQINFLNSINIPVTDLNPKFISGMVNEFITGKQSEIVSTASQQLLDPNTDQTALLAEIEAQKIKLNKLLPKWRNSESIEILPLDALYISNELGKEAILTTEMRDIIKARYTSAFNKNKEQISRYFKTLPLFLQINIEEYDDLNVEEFENKLNALIKDVENSSNIKELKANTAAITSFVSGLTIEQISKEYSESDSESFDNIKNDLKDYVNKIPKIAETLQLFENLITKPVIENQLLNLLNTITLEVFSEKDPNRASVLNILENELNNFQLVSKPQDYVREKDVIENMRKAKTVLELTKAISIAMLDTSIDASNPYGYNVSIINGLTKEDTKQDANNYRVITPESQVLFSRELDRIESKLDFLISLAESNSGTIINEDKKVKENGIKLFLSALTDVNNPTSALNLKINGHSLLEEDDLASINTGIKSDEERLIDIEEAIHNNFKKYATPGQLEEDLDNIFSLYKEKENFDKLSVLDYVPITKDSTYIGIANYFNYLHMLLATNSKEFYISYKNILEKEIPLPDKKVPFYMQEFSLRLGHAYIKNKEVMSHVMRFINKNHDKSKSGRAFLENILLITGSGGVGKTTISSFLKAFLNEEKVISAGPNERLYNNLKTALTRGTEDKVLIGDPKNIFTILGVEELHKEFTLENDELVRYGEELSKQPVFGSWVDEHPFTDKKTIVVKDFLRDDIKLSEEFKNRLKERAKELKEKYVIFFDEVSWMNPLELQMIDVLAETDQVSFVGLGDPLQKGYSLGIFAYSLDSIYYNGNPKMSGVIRSNNIHKKDNVTLLNVLLSKWNKESIKFLEEVEITYFDKGKLHGDKFVDSIEEEDLSLLDRALEVVIINENGAVDKDLEDKLIKLGFSKYRFISNNDIQGDQFDQVISTIKIPYNGSSSFLAKRSAFKDLYTLLSRAKQSTLVVGNKDILKFVNVVNAPRKFTSNVNFSINELEEVLKERIAFLSKLKLKEVETIEKVEKEEEVTTPTFIPKITEDPIINDITDTEILETPEEILDGDNKFITYSFYNVLHAEYKDNQLSVDKVDIPSDMQTIHMLGSKGLSILNTKNPKTLINDFIHIKNILLHNVANIGNITNKVSGNQFNFLLNSTGKVVVRKLKYNNKDIQPYGKQAHIEGKEPKAGKDQLFLAYKGKIGEQEFYITLAALPDTENKNWNQISNKAFLNNTFKDLKDGESIEISDFTIKPYNGIRFIYTNGLSEWDSTKDTNIEITGNTFQEFTENLKERAPGIQIADSRKLEVFTDNTVAIQELFDRVGYKLGIKPKLKNPEAFRFRPFIKVSFVDETNDSTSRIIALSPRKRSLKEAIEEYKEVITKEAELNEEDRKDFWEKNIAVLISKWEAASLVGKFLSKATEAEQEKIIKTILISESTKIGVEGYAKYAEELTSILKRLGSIKGDLSLLKDKKELDFILGNTKESLVKRNLGLILFKVLAEQKPNSLIHNIMEIDGEVTMNTEIYYSAKLQPTGNESGIREIDSSYIKYFKVSSFIEPPQFMIDLSNVKLGNYEQKKEEVLPPKPVVEKELAMEDTFILESPIGTIVLDPNEDGKSKLGNWTNLNNLLKAKFTLDTMLQQIEVLMSGDNLSEEAKIEIRNINLEAYKKCISNTGFILGNGNINTQFLWKLPLESFKASPNAENIFDYIISKSNKIDLKNINNSWKSNTETNITKNLCK